METGILAQVRAGCAAVAAQARSITILPERIPAYAASLPLETVQRPVHDAATHYLEHGADTVAFFVTLDAINFGSGYFPHLRKRPGMSGYFTVALSLKEYFEQHGPLSAAQLAALTAEDCRRIFGQDQDNEPIQEMMCHFAVALNDLGRFLHERYDGDVMGLVADAGASVERMAELLVAMPYFRDIAQYHGMEVPILKRAQITAADLWIAFDGQGPGRFDDLDRLTIYADNLVPHVLRADGILEYDPALAARIDRQELIAPGSEEEVEIRACAVHTVELIVDALRRDGHDVYAMHLDYLLWNRGQDPYYKDIFRRHRTRTVFY